MSKEVILATDTENISLTGNNETYTKSEIDKRLALIQYTIGGIGTVVYTGTVTSDCSAWMPDTEFDYLYIPNGNSNSYKLLPSKDDAVKIDGPNLIMTSGNGSGKMITTYFLFQFNSKTSEWHLHWGTSYDYSYEGASITFYLYKFI